MTEMDRQKIADALYQAEAGRYQIDMITAQYSDMTVEDAYHIQLIKVQRKISAGEKIIGMKIGLTSKAMQNLLGVGEPDYGHLTDRMLLLEGETCPCAELLQPKVEGELSFCLKKTLKGPGVTIADVYNATAWGVPSIEIVDSRIKNWTIKLPDTVADNGSSARFVLGSGMTPIDRINMRLIGMTMEKNGELVNSGAGAEVLGNPAASVAWLANKISAFGIELKEGSIVMAGALPAAQPAHPGDSYTVSFDRLGSVTAKFV